MIAVECLKCGNTSYTADPVSVNPCPYCGTSAIERNIRSLTEMDRMEESSRMEETPTPAS